MTLKKYSKMLEIVYSVILFIMFWIPIIFYFHTWKQRLIAGIYFYLFSVFSAVFGKIKLFEKLYNEGKL